MPFELSIVTADPNPISLPGETEVSYTITGTAGTKLSIEYSISTSNNIEFVGEANPKVKVSQAEIQGDLDITERLRFRNTGTDEVLSFFLSVKAINIKNSMTKLRKVQMRIS